MERLRQMVGNERAIGELPQKLYFWGQGQGAAGFGALHVTCADESETECVEAFQKGFVDFLLPSLKFSRRAAFRLANLGGRHEWGAARLAEDHFLPAPGSQGFTLMVGKINAHVACEEDPAGKDLPCRLGALQRYGETSACCGALDALLRGEHGSHLDELREALDSEGKDRFAALLDEQRVEPRLRPLYAAMVSARLQARKIVLEIQDHEPPSPIYWLVAPCVTINRPERDTEILCGLYSIDGRQGRQEVVYSGLGDDPSAYQFSLDHRRMVITDDQLGRERAGRDHRKRATEMAGKHEGIRVHEVKDERLDRVRQDVMRNRHRNHHHGRALLKIALPILAEVAPIPLALFAFAQGAAGIHHAQRIHRLASEMEGTEEARLILDDMHRRINQLDGEHAEALLELLMEDYSRGH